jgi:acetolactate decarboxylase
MLRTPPSFILALTLPLLFAGCAAPPGNGITQVATIDALLSGVYDGHMSLRELRTHGDFGIGTFESLDGEMILLDGAFYKVRADGKVYQPTLTERTPFACVTPFNPDINQQLMPTLNMNTMQARINDLIPESNRFVAFKVHGNFRQVRTRSVPAQTKPYPPLTEVTKTQPVFSLSNTRGTLLGFRSPAFVQGVNVPGYHLHFLADDRSGGGHVLDFELDAGTLQADTLHEWLHLYLPSGNAAFNTADLTRDRATDLHNVEKASITTRQGESQTLPKVAPTLMR